MNINYIDDFWIILESLDFCILSSFSHTLSDFVPLRPWPLKVHSRAELQEAVQDNGRAGTFAGDRGTELCSGAVPMEKPRSSRWASSDRHSMRGPCRWGAIWGKFEHHNKGLENRAWNHFGFKTGALQLLQQSHSLIMKLDSLGLHVEWNIPKSRFQCEAAKNC